MTSPLAGPPAFAATQHPPRSEPHTDLDLPRTDGAPTGAPHSQQLVILPPRDRAIVETVGQLRLVTADQLRRLHFAGPDASSHNHRIARRCLARLAEQGWLWRAERSVGGAGSGSQSWTYCLGSRGVRALGGKRRRAGSPSFAFLAHQLAASETFTVLHGALGRGELEALDVTVEPHCWRRLDDGTGSTLKPDLSVVAATPDAEWLAFIEIDNGTEHAAAIGRKAALYRRHWQSGREQAAQGVYPQVIWQAQDPGRRAELRRLLGRDPAAQLHRVIAPQQLIQQLTKGGPP